MAKWQIGRRVAACGACEREFADGDRLFSMLLSGEEGLERRDLCVSCYSDDAVQGALFWWRTRHRTEEERGLKLDLEAIEALFLALDPHRGAGSEGEGDGEEPEQDAPRTVSQRLLELRYLMCLILLRKRRVKVVKVAREHAGVQGEFFLVKRPRRQEQLAVQVFDFDGDKIAALREDLTRIFEGADPAELEAEEARAADPDPADAPEPSAVDPDAVESDETARTD